MNNAVILHTMIRRNQLFVEKAVSDLSQDDSLLQLGGNSNCMNWVLGHIAVYRDAMLACSNHTALLTERQREPYCYGSQPITAGSVCVVLDVLLEKLSESYNLVGEWLLANPDNILEAPPNYIDLHSDYGSTIVENLGFLCWHEANHVGELHALRELAVTDSSS
tara:strand:+ start:42 stop:533 length:492 start_codon:yes stop_codon:yes gene_type:complete